jgi:hypothetical protein
MGVQAGLGCAFVLCYPDMIGFVSGFFDVLSIVSLSLHVDGQCGREYVVLSRQDKAILSAIVPAIKHHPLKSASITSSNHDKSSLQS